MEDNSWEKFLEDFNKTTDSVDRAHIGNYIAALKKYVKREKFNPPTKNENNIQSNRMSTIR